jgi:cobalt/nickel transport system permease protein
MGIAAMAAFFIFHLLSKKLKLLGAFAGGFIAVLTGTLIVVLALFFSDNDLKATAVLLFAANVPLAAVEGVLSVFIVAFLSKMAPPYVS